MIEKILKDVIEAENQVKLMAEKARQKGEKTLLASTIDAEKIMSEAKTKASQKCRKFEEANEKKKIAFFEENERTARLEAKKLATEHAENIERISDELVEEILTRWQL